MLFHKNPNDSTSTMDIYPFADNRQDAAFQSRFTIVDNKIYFGGGEWTLERIQQEKERVRQLEEAFLVAQAIIECERGVVQ